MVILGTVLFLIGFIVAMTGGIWTLVLAFQDHIGWGFACLFIPFAALVFSIKKWNRRSVRRSFLLSMSGFISSLIGSVIWVTSMGVLFASSLKSSGSFKNGTFTYIPSPIPSESSEEISLSPLPSPTPSESSAEIPLSPLPSPTPSESSAEIPLSSLPSPANQSHPSFRKAVNNAMKAAQLTQTAKTKEQWATVTTVWQEAIQLMNAIPADSPNYGVAQQKVQEYQKNLAYSKKNAQTP